jgi:hypothetical protein
MKKITSKCALQITNAKLHPNVSNYLRDEIFGRPDLPLKPSFREEYNQHVKLKRNTYSDGPWLLFELEHVGG